MARMSSRAIVSACCVILLCLLSGQCHALLQYGVVKYRVKSVKCPHWKWVEYWNNSDREGVLLFKCGDVFFTDGDRPSPHWVAPNTFIVRSKKRQQPEIVACDIRIPVRAHSEGTTWVKMYCFDESCPAAPSGTVYDYPLMYDEGARTIMLSMNEASPLNDVSWKGGPPWSAVVALVKDRAESHSAFMDANVYNFRAIQKRLWRYIEHEDQDLYVYRGERNPDEGMLPRIDPWWTSGMPITP